MMQLTAKIVKATNCLPFVTENSGKTKINCVAFAVFILLTTLVELLTEMAN